MAACFQGGRDLRNGKREYLLITGCTISVSLPVNPEKKTCKLKGIKQNRTGGQNKSLDAPATILHLILKQKGSD